MNTDMRGAISEVGRTFSTITNILSFLPGEHSHTICFEVLVEQPWIGVEVPYSTETAYRHQRGSPKTAARNATTHFANWANRFGPIFCPNYENA